MSSLALTVASDLRARHLRGDVPDYEHLLELGYRRFLKRGWVVLDVGAHNGRHTDCFAAIVGLLGRVVAFEPIPAKAAALRKRYRWRPNVSVRELALAEGAGSATFVLVENYPEESGLRRRVYNQADAKTVEISVRVSKLDEETERLGRVDFIKLDVEGAELSVLAGAEGLLRRARPLISIEYGRPAYSAYGHGPEALWLFAAAHGYQISDLLGNTIDSREEWDRICDSAYWDYFLVPIEKLSGWVAQMEPGAASLPTIA